MLTVYSPVHRGRVRHISFSASFLLSAFLLRLCLNSEVAARYPVTGSPPPPSPPRPSPISPRIMKVYTVIQAFKNQIFYDPLNITGTWDEKVKDVCKYKGFSWAKVPDFKQQALAGVDFNGYGLPDIRTEAYLSLASLKS
ncbi:hypothetical protein CJ030_MR8G028966 [Morella rubra]|uniref:Uncharacterized protein n=1 Tax=Morella rubra TaxID=262757 RepID=A0A6A1UU11_9ROSI|nr:hypothetical protein CJ030_MR8G028966 [Morella rubra]